LDSPTTQGQSERRAVVSLVAIGVALRIVVLAWARGAMVDDAYVTLRCVRNLLAGHGLVYNAGERVLATTAPLYGLIASAAAWLSRGIDLGYVIGALNIAAFAGSAVLLSDLAADLGRRTTLLVLIVFAGYLAFVDNSTIGMETPIFILGIVLSLRLMRRGRMGWVSLVLGLLVLVRPEGAIWALALTAGGWFTGRRPRPVCVVPGLAVAAAWIAISVRLYGSAIPYSVRSKCGWLVPFTHQPLLVRSHHAFASLALLDSPPALRGSGLTAALLTAAAPVSAALFAVGAVVLLRRRRLASALPLLFLGYLLFYLGAKGRPDFSWYGIPSGLAYCATASVGLAAIVRRTVRADLRERLASVALPLLTAILVATTLWGWRIVRLPYYRTMRSSYEAAGSLIDATAPGDARVLVDEAGMLGYAARRHVFDLDGVVSPEVAALRSSAGWWCPVGEIVRAVDPDFIAVSWARAKRLLSEDGAEWIRANYDTLGRFPAHVVMRRIEARASPP
jgi:hypothetical protein